MLNFEKITSIIQSVIDMKKKNERITNNSQWNEILFIMIFLILDLSN